jgi:hypothetical protein
MRIGTRYAKLVFLHPVGYAGHIVQSRACSMNNVDVLFFMLWWDLYGCHKTSNETRCAKLAFLHLVGSIGHVVHFGAYRLRNIEGLFFMLGWARCGVVSIKSMSGHVMPNFCFFNRWDL